MISTQPFIVRCAGVRDGFLVDTFGSRLKHARERLDISQETLAQRAGTTLQTVWRWENDKVEPKISGISSLAEVLGVDERWLAFGELGGETEEPDALAAFLETRLGKTATPGEVADLRTLRPRTGRPTIDTYHSMLLALRGTMEPILQEADVAAKAAAVGAIKVKRTRK